MLIVLLTASRLRRTVWLVSRLQRRSGVGLGRRCWRQSLESLQQLPDPGLAVPAAHHGRFLRVSAAAAAARQQRQRSQRPILSERLRAEVEHHDRFSRAERQRRRRRGGSEQTDAVRSRAERALSRRQNDPEGLQELQGSSEAGGGRKTRRRSDSTVLSPSQTVRLSQVTCLLLLRDVFNLSLNLFSGITCSWKAPCRIVTQIFLTIYNVPKWISNLITSSEIILLSLKISLNNIILLLKMLQTKDRNV